MKLSEQWKHASGTAKTMVILSALLLVQIGMCALTPTAVPWIETVFGVTPSNDPFQTIGQMAMQAILAIVTFIVLFIVWLAWLSKRNRPNTGSSEESHD